MKPNPLILAVETSGRTGSVAIALGEQILAEAAFSGPMRHSAELFPAVSALLKNLARKPEQIDHIYISVGPGSFTGLRIAVTMAKTMHLASFIKIVAVDTLDAIAANVTIENTVHPSSHSAGRLPQGMLCITAEPQVTCPETTAVILDAKRSQFFIAVYQRNTSHGIWKKILPDSLMTAAQFLEQFARREKPVWLLGEGLVYYRDKFKADGIHFFDEKYWFPRAAKVHLLGWQKALIGQFADPLTLTPNYLRRPDVSPKNQAK
jgi:tRNA threonylcarbamoyladenosine biosynthesis protein TsaB